MLTVRDLGIPAPDCCAVVTIVDDEEWRSELLDEYRTLRTTCVVALDEVPLEGLDFDVTEIEQRLMAARRAPHSRGVFNTLRSDYGETAAGIILHKLYGTRFGYHAVRDREIPSQPGRGIDLLGVEEDSEGTLTLVCGQVKVSEEIASPPQVVDRDSESLRNQHLRAVTNLEKTTSEVWNAAAFARDASLRNALFRAAILLESHGLSGLGFVCASVLIRPQARAADTDCGTFGASPADYRDGVVRFLTLVVPDGMDTLLDEWSAAIDGAA